jgi:hypothetical protein
MRRWIVVGLALVLPVAAVRLATLAGWLPVWRAAEEREVAGAPSFAGGRGTAALLVPATVPAVTGFAAGPWTYGWINFLQQELGPYAVRSADVAADGPTDLIVVPRALARGPRPGLPEGGTVIVECPGEAWRDLLGSTAEPEALRLETIRSDRLRAPLRALLVPCPPAGRPAEVLAADDAGRPLIWRTLHEGTRWIGLGFDLAHSVLAAQQGVPAEDLRVENRFPGRHRDLLQTSDLVVAEEFLDTSDPAADRLERLLGIVLDETFPRPRLWYHPDAATGVFVMTHDDEAFGDRSRWMTEFESRIGARSTMLLQRGKALTRDGVAAMCGDGAEIGLHWNRLRRAGADYRSTIWLGVEWVRRRTSLAEQTAWLRSTLPEGTAIRSARTHFLVWGPDYASGFRALAAEGFVADSSYGVDFGERGYLFGTGRPFQALDVNGLPLPIWEIPHLMSEDLAADRAWLDRVLEQSAASEHQVVNVLFHPIDMDWRPSVGLYELWRSSYELARRHGHAILTMEELTDFWRRRSAGRVELRRTPGGFRVRAEVVGPDHAVALPATWEGASLVPGAPAVRVQEGARPSLLVRVPDGSSSFDVRLEAP